MAETKEIIRELCRKNGISVTSLEAELGFGNGSLTKGTSVRSDRLLIVARYFHVPIEYLLTGEMPEYYYDSESADIAQAINDNAELRALFDNVRGIGADDLKIVADMAKRLKETNPNG